MVHRHVAVRLEELLEVLWIIVHHKKSISVLVKNAVQADAALVRTVVLLQDFQYRSFPLGVLMSNRFDRDNVPFVPFVNGLHNNAECSLPQLARDFV